MPVRKVGTNQWKWGSSGKTYPSKAQAARQGRAIKASMGASKKGPRKTKV